jgi:hypothetical protein
MAFFTWLESSAFSTWIKESPSIWPYDLLGLAAHAVGMAILVGVSSAVALRILGIAPQLPLAPMKGLFPVMYAGFWINVLSGTELLVAYPVKAVTNPVFYLKIIGVVLAFLCLRRIRRHVFVDGMRVDAGSVGRSGRILAGALLFIWLATITAGRLMAYHDVGNVERDTVIAVFIVTAAMVLAWYAATRRWGRSLELGAEHTSRSHVASRR